MQLEAEPVTLTQLLGKQRDKVFRGNTTEYITANYNNAYMCVCVCLGTRARVCVSVCACVRVWGGGVIDQTKFAKCIF